MNREYVAEGPTLEDALDVALEELGVQQDAVGYEVLDEGGKKMFGLAGAKSVKVRVWVKESFLDEMQAADDDASPEPDATAEVGNEADRRHEPASDLPELTDEQIDAIADTANEVVREIVGYCGITELEIEEYEGDEGELILDLVGNNLAFIIGRHGRTLEALQTAVSAIVTKRTGFHYPVSVDIEGYKHRRKQRVVEIATRAAERARTQNRSVPLKPMPASERRVVHMTLRNVSGITTASEGTGEYRHVVILPARR